MTQLSRMGVGLGGSGRRGSSSATVQALVYETEAQTIITALNATGSTISTRRERTINSFVKKAKALGLWSKMDGIWFLGDTEAQWLVNWKTPGTFNLIKNGSPSFSAANGVSSAATTAFYDTQITLASRSQNSCGMGFFSTVGSSATSSVDMGARDSTTSGMFIAALNTSNGVNARCMDAGASITGNFSQPGFRGINRTAGSGFDGFNYSLKNGSVVVASASSASSNKIAILKDVGGTSFSTRTIGMAYVQSVGLTDTEVGNWALLCQSTLNAIRFGEPLFEEVGIGTATINVDIAIYGASLAAIQYAIEAKRQNPSRTVAIIGNYLEKTLGDIGGHPANGLAWADTKDLTAVTALFRTLLTRANAIRSVTDSNNQNGYSVYPLIWNWVCRHALDPARTSTFTGVDVPLYFSGGIKTAVKTNDGTHLGTWVLTTMDGRTVNCKGLIGADYDGDVLPLSGIPFITGTEAAGGSNESINGYDPTNVNKPTDDTGSLDIDPYITPGNAGSGLIADVIDLPSITTGAADPILQAINFRLAFTNSAPLMAPLTGGFALAQPPNYSAARYEPFGRYFAAATLAGHTITLESKFLAIQGPISQNSSRFDCNNGTCGISTDLPQSGLAYIAAGSSYTARLAVIRDIREYMQGLFYWILQSGDIRIPAALKTALQGYGLSVDHFLDADTPFWPNLPYLRDPLYQLSNTGFKLGANTIWQVDGTTPASTKTIAVASYNADRHAPRRVVSGGLLKVQGGYGVDVGLGGPCGANNRAPIPMEVVMPDKAQCTNYLTPTHPSWTKVAHSVARMEFTHGLLAQGCAIIMENAIANDIPVQDVNYTTIRTAFLAVPDAVTPILPQLN